MIQKTITDADIEAAIASNDDPGHPDAYSVDDVRDVLDRINADIIDWWSEHEDAIDDDAYELVHETKDVLVLAEGGHFWREQFDAMQLGDENGILRSVVVSLHHTAARKHCDYSWSVSTPVVVRKPEHVRTGEAHALREIARRADEFGSVARAVDTLATDVHGWRKGDWATLTGRTASAVSQTTDN